jgi:Flp pilus assembly protein TadG
MLESAMCFLPMMAMFFGVIDVCFAVSIQSLFSQAVRAGSRWAITYQTTYNGTACTSQAVCIAQVVQDNSIGMLSGSPSSYITVNYYISNNLATPIMTCTAGTCTAAATPVLPYTYTATTTTGTTSVTISYANQPGNIVEVSIPAYPLLWMVPLIGSGSYATQGYSAGSTTTGTSGQTGLGLTINAFADDVLGGLAQGTTIPPSP